MKRTEIIDKLERFIDNAMPNNSDFSYDRDVLDAIYTMIEVHAKEKCREQQLLAIEHLFDVGQTEFVKDKQEMPYPEFN